MDATDDTNWTRCRDCGELYEDNGPCACPDEVCAEPHATEAEAMKCAEDARWLRRMEVR